VKSCDHVCRCDPLHDHLRSVVKEGIAQLGEMFDKSFSLSEQKGTFEQRNSRQSFLDMLVTNAELRGLVVNMLTTTQEVSSAVTSAVNYVVASNCHYATAPSSIINIWPATYPPPAEYVVLRDPDNPIILQPLIVHLEEMVPELEALQTAWANLNIALDNVWHGRDEWTEENMRPFFVARGRVILAVQTLVASLRVARTESEHLFVIEDFVDEEGWSTLEYELLRREEDEAE
jgi:hypothetical protein